MATLRHRDGFWNQRPELRPEVERLQRELTSAGFNVVADGLFGQNTLAAVKDFQRANGLVADGVVADLTWTSLREVNQRPPRPGFDVADRWSELPGFRGDIEWVHAREGHAGKPYWPGGESGVTLDPGFDLGRQNMATTRELYDGILNRAELRSIEAVIGLRGRLAKAALDEKHDLLAIRISRRQAARVMPFVAAPYWRQICHRFPRLREESTPASVQTALLSLAYNRGAGNADLGCLEDLIESGRWLECAAQIGSMQQDHEIEGIRKRRWLEAKLIRDSHLV